MSDSFNLERFVTAQNPEFDNVLSELMRGSKRGHWMWFIFPQLKDLGKSATANYFGISSLAEAEAYLKHPVLGRRLVECVGLVNIIEGRSAQEIFGGTDSMKFRSSMTLFGEIGQDREIFAKALSKYFEGRADKLTLDLLRRHQQSAEA